MSGKKKKTTGAGTRKGKPAKAETISARPARAPRRPARLAGTRTGGKPPPAGNLVLVVDDFQDNREMYVQYLSFAGYRVAEAVDGEDALAKARSLLPDVIVMDLSLPRLDGWEATRRLKKDPLTRAIPVIALTGHALAGHAEGALGAGCDAFVTKPCVPSELEARVREMLHRAGTAAAPAKPRR
jgi:two-component system cell cycle response regulator DivK